MAYRFIELGEVFFRGEDRLINYMKENGLLPTNKRCDDCETQMTMTKCDVNDDDDGYNFRCPNCLKCISLRDGTFFAKSHISLQKWMLIVYFWSQRYTSIEDTAIEAGISEQLAIATYQLLRDIYWRNLQQPIHPEKIVQVWRKEYGRHAYLNIIKHIAECYPV